MKPLSIRKIAEMQGMSHTSVHNYSRLDEIAQSRGLQEEFKSLTMAGKKPSEILRKLMPDVLEERKAKQQINQFRSTVRWLLKNGFDADDLMDFIHNQLINSRL